MLSSARRRQAVSYVHICLRHSERRICRALGVALSAVGYERQPKPDKSTLPGSIVRWVGHYGRDGYRWGQALLKSQDWYGSHGRVARIWPHEGLNVPDQQSRRGRLSLNNGSSLRLRPERPNPVWSVGLGVRQNG